ncbi:hypothetical protein CF319_g5856 [Tilletia indica]|nr:hypothetical protein CF319_g5856 [Tilletia indica]
MASSQESVDSVSTIDSRLYPSVRRPNLCGQLDKVPFNPAPGPRTVSVNETQARIHIERLSDATAEDFADPHSSVSIEHRFLKFFHWAEGVLAFDRSRWDIPYGYYSVLVQHVLDIGRYEVLRAHTASQALVAATASNLIANQSPCAAIAETSRHNIIAPSSVDESSTSAPQTSMPIKTLTPGKARVSFAADKTSSSSTIAAQVSGSSSSTTLGAPPTASSKGKKPLRLLNSFADAYPLEWARRMDEKEREERKRKRGGFAPDTDTEDDTADDTADDPDAE